MRMVRWGSCCGRGLWAAAVKEKITKSVQSAIQKVSLLGRALPADVAGRRLSAARSSPTAVEDACGWP